MNLIDEKVIEEAAKEHINHCILIGEYDRSTVSFKSGCNFTQQQLQPFIIEFAEWIDMYYQRSLNGKWRGIDMPVCDTTEQLLEEFINSKTK